MLCQNVKFMHKFVNFLARRYMALATKVNQQQTIPWNIYLRETINKLYISLAMLWNYF